MLGEGPQVGFVGDGDRCPERFSEGGSQGDVTPAEVGRGGDEPVVAADHADDGDTDADQRLTPPVVGDAIGQLDETATMWSGVTWPRGCSTCASSTT